MKAVIWTDVWQIMWMVAGFVAILAVTCIDFGGFMEVVNLNIVSRDNVRVRTLSRMLDILKLKSYTVSDQTVVSIIIIPI